MLFLVAVVVVYLRNNHALVVDLSNRVSEYIHRYTKPDVTSFEVHHIGFLKVHKAGGSTVQNVLFRFGLKRHLSIIIPEHKYKFSTYYGEPHTELMRTNDNCYDMLAIHSVYNESVYSELLPNDTINIAIIRDPLELMISGAYYHRNVWQVDYLQKVPRENYIENLILYPELYDTEEFSLTKNSMAMDFGFPLGIHVTDSQKIEDYLQYIEAQFPLVMVTEYFDESLVLLKRLLHWNLEDILYIPLNEYKHPTVVDLNISVIDKRKFEERNFLDVAIYRYFRQKFSQLMAALGNDFQQEVKHFRTIRNRVEQHCVFHEGDDAFEIQESIWNKHSVVLQTDCAAMRTTEIVFIDQIRALIKQKGIRLHSRHRRASGV